MVGAAGILAIALLGAGSPVHPIEQVSTGVGLAPPALVSAPVDRETVDRVAPDRVMLAPRALPPMLPRRAVAETSPQGTLTVETRPDAVVMLDGETIEHGSFSGRRTASGRHQLAVKLPRRGVVKRWIWIAPDRETRLKIETVSRTAVAESSPLAASRAATAELRPAAPTGAVGPLAAPQDPDPGSSAAPETSHRLALNPDAPAMVAELEPEIVKAGAPASPVIKQPSLDPVATRAAVQNQIGPLRQCYERARMDDASLRGVLTVRITIAVNGSIAAVQISSSTLSAPQVEGCITHEITRWRLPPPSGGAAASFSYPFVFE
jgi:hypothetical protein